MKNKDEYIIEDDGHSYTFKKNGRIHREEGPAYFSYGNINKNEYLNLEDKYLYKFKQIPSDKRELLFESEMKRLKYELWQAGKIHYFLEGEEYSKEEFEKIKARKDLKNELSTELPIVQSNAKRNKL
jgi:hypothetical protein